MKLQRSWSRLPLSFVTPLGQYRGRKSRSKSKPRRQSLGLELLESRIVPVTISTYQAQVLRDGLQGLANFGTNLDSFAQLANSLPIVDQPLGQILNIVEDLHKGLADPVKTFLDPIIAASGTTDTDTLVNSVLKNLSGTFGGLTVTVPSGSVTGGMGTNDIEFHLNLHAARSNIFSIDLGRLASALGNSADGAAQVTFNTTHD